MSVLSLLLCVATLALWVRSRRTGDFFSRYRSGRYWAVSSCSGQLYVERGMTSYPDASRWRSGPPHYWFLTPTNIDWQFVGFAHLTGSPEGLPRPFSVLVVPYWSFLPVFLAAPGFWMLRRRRHRIGHCPRCGYDLRATPDRCPECGCGRDVET